MTERRCNCAGCVRMSAGLRTYTDCLNLGCLNLGAACVSPAGAGGGNSGIWAGGSGSAPADRAILSSRVTDHINLSDHSAGADSRSLTAAVKSVIARLGDQEFTTAQLHSVVMERQDDVCARIRKNSNCYQIVRDAIRQMVADNQLVITTPWKKSYRYYRAAKQAPINLGEFAPGEIVDHG